MKTTHDLIRSSHLHPLYHGPVYSSALWLVCCYAAPHAACCTACSDTQPSWSTLHFWAVCATAALPWVIDEPGALVTLTVPQLSIWLVLISAYCEHQKRPAVWTQTPSKFLRSLHLFFLFPTHQQLTVPFVPSISHTSTDATIMK